VIPKDLDKYLNTVEGGTSDRKSQEMKLDVEKFNKA